MFAFIKDWQHGCNSWLSLFSSKHSATWSGRSFAQCVLSRIQSLSENVQPVDCWQHVDKVLLATMVSRCPHSHCHSSTPAQRSNVSLSTTLSKVQALSCF